MAGYIRHLPPLVPTDVFNSISLLGNPLPTSLLPGSCIGPQGLSHLAVPEAPQDLRELVVAHELRQVSDLLGPWHHLAPIGSSS